MPSDSPFRTRADLITSALSKLGVAVSNQPPEVEDVRYVDLEIDAICRKLEGLEIVFVADRGQFGPQGGNIPGEWFDDLASIVADLAASKFGLPQVDAERITKEGLGSPPGTGDAAMSLKKITRGRYTGETLPSTYFGYAAAWLAYPWGRLFE